MQTNQVSFTPLIPCPDTGPSAKRAGEARTTMLSPHPPQHNPKHQWRCTLPSQRFTFNLRPLVYLRTRLCGGHPTGIPNCFSCFVRFLTAQQRLNGALRALPQHGHQIQRSSHMATVHAATSFAYVNPQNKWPAPPPASVS